jgi:hypothetical protein
VNLSQQAVFLFGGFEGFHYPTTKSGFASGGAYLVPTSVGGTFAVKWIVPESGARMPNVGQQVTLASRG